MNKDFSGITVEGVPMDMEVLKTAGIESCDGVAVATPDDNLNITVSQIAREFFGVRNVVARISDPAREQVFKKLGLKSICHTKWAGEAMLNALVRPWDDRHLTIETSTIGFRSYLVEKRDWGDTPGGPGPPAPGKSPLWSSTATAPQNSAAAGRSPWQRGTRSSFPA